MIIEINISGVVTLTDVDNFRSFKVSAACTKLELADALGGIGQVDNEGEAWISRVWLLASGRPDDPRWVTGFETMHKYAGDHGWVNSKNDSVRAHVEYTPPLK